MMVEKDTSVITMPPYSTCRLCRNCMNQACMEECAPKKDYSWFEVKQGVNLEDLPRFPLEEFNNGMSSTVRQKIVAVYISKIVDYLQGVRDERKHIYGSRSSAIFKALQKQGISLGPEGHNPEHQDRSERKDSGERLDEVAGEKSDFPNP